MRYDLGEKKKRKTYFDKCVNFRLYIRAPNTSSLPVQTIINYPRFWLLDELANYKRDSKSSK